MVCGFKTQKGQWWWQQGRLALIHSQAPTESILINQGAKTMSPHRVYIRWIIKRSKRWGYSIHFCVCIEIKFYLYSNQLLLQLPPGIVWCHWREIEPFSATLAQDGLAVCNWLGKIPWNTLSRPGMEPKPLRGQTMRYIHFPLGYHDSGYGQHRQWDTFISHWGIMTRVMDSTDSETHSFFHWGIMTRLWTAQTVRHIHSSTEVSWLGLWTGQTVRYIHSSTEVSWLGLWTGQTMRYIHFPLRYHDSGYGQHRQWDTFILPLRYHDPGYGQHRQWDTFTLPLRYHDSGYGEDRQWDAFILLLSYHDWLMISSI